MIAALSYAGKPVVLLDGEHNYDCPYGLTFSEHPIDGLIEAVRSIKPSIEASLAESIAYRIHCKISAYLQAKLVVANRRSGRHSARTICPAPGSPLGSLRRMRDSVERRDFRCFLKNYDLLPREARRTLSLIVEDKLWGKQGARLIYPSLADFRASCSKLGFALTTYFKLRADPLADVTYIKIMIDLSIAKLRTKGRRPSPERDQAAAEVIFQYFGFLLGDWTGPRQPSHIIGDSQRNGSLVDFLDAVELCYGLSTPALRLIPRSSGAAWARINSLVVEKMGLSGAA